MTNNIYMSGLTAFREYNQRLAAAIASLASQQGFSLGIDCWGGGRVNYMLHAPTTRDITIWDDEVVTYGSAPVAGDKGPSPEDERRALEVLHRHLCSRRHNEQSA